jgi:hypothetical protein
MRRHREVEAYRVMMRTVLACGGRKILPTSLGLMLQEDRA